MELKPEPIYSEKPKRGDRSKVRLISEQFIEVPARTEGIGPRIVRVFTWAPVRLKRVRRLH
jgi:hypothetical protein